MRYYKVVTAPVLTPVSVSDCKSELVIEHSRHDTYIGTLITRAVDYLEKYLERPIMEQEIEFITNEKGKGLIRVPSPIISLDAITAVDVNPETLVETSTALDVSDFTIRDEVDPVGIFGNFDAVYDYHKVEMTVGYESASVVPGGIKDLVFMLVSARYTDRLDFHKVDIRPLATNYRYNTFSC